MECVWKGRRISDGRESEEVGRGSGEVEVVGMVRQEGRKKRLRWKKEW